MKKFDEVTEKFGKVPFMKEKQAEYIKFFMKTFGLYNVLELGFAHGKSSAYIAAIIEDNGAGKLTTIDKANAIYRDPPIEKVLSELDLRHWVNVVYAGRSYTWELGKMIKQDSKPFFDLCYLDAGHTWDVTGYGFFLVDLLLKSGGWIIFDDLDWTIAKSEARSQNTNVNRHAKYSEEERQAKGVRMVFEHLVPHLGYINKFEETAFGWGIAQKPFA